MNQNETEGILYLVPTPIGNLGDMSFRAIETLERVDLIAAEDTRHTQKLLNHFNIQTPQISFHEHNTIRRIPELIDKLLHGKSIAQVSDAGMPSISDPGYELVAAAIQKGIQVTPLPGPNAALTALIASGLTPQPFYFYGFLPRQKKEKKASLEELKGQTATIIFYESPHRLKDVLKDIEEVMGGKRRIVLAREVTKQYEEFIRGSTTQVLEHLKEIELRGEFVVLLEGAQAEEWQENSDVQYLSYTAHVERLMALEGLNNKEAIKEVAKRIGISKRVVYSEYHDL